MKEKKLTDEEIVKALDICYNDVHCSVDCPYFNLYGRNFCQDKELYKDLKRIVQEHAEQMAEIERLTEENRQLVKIGNGFALERNNLREELDELKESGNCVLLTSLYKKQADDHKRGLSVQRAYWEKKVQQAVKDTAKEILQELWGETEPNNENHKWVRLRIKNIASRKGVEVE